MEARVDGTAKGLELDEAGRVRGGGGGRRREGRRSGFYKERITRSPETECREAETKLGGGEREGGEERGERSTNRGFRREGKKIRTLFHVGNPLPWG